MPVIFHMVRGRIVVLLALSVMLGACAGPKIAEDLLVVVKPNEQPITSSGYQTSVTINPRINNYEELDKSVQQSLQIALDAAKIFTPASASKYMIKADITIAAEATMSFGTFVKTLEIHYTVLDPSGRVVIEKTLNTEFGSDHYYFSGAMRHQRARAVNMAENVLQFVDFLRTSVDLKGGGV